MVVQGALKGALQVSDACGCADGSEFPLDVDMIMEVVVAVSLTPTERRLKRIPRPNTPHRLYV